MSFQKGKGLGMTRTAGTEKGDLRYTKNYGAHGVNGLDLTVVFCLTLIGHTIFFAFCS